MSSRVPTQGVHHQSETARQGLPQFFQPAALGGHLIPHAEQVPVQPGGGFGEGGVGPSARRLDLVYLSGQGGQFRIDPAELTAAGAYISFPLDNAKYNGSLDRSDLAAFAARVRSFANWVSDDATAYPLTANSLFPGN